LRGQDAVGSLEKVAEKNPGTKITRYYLRHRVIVSSAAVSNTEDAVGLLEKVAQKNPGTKITRYYLRVIVSSAAVGIVPKTF